jgi:hypothetical protein
LTFYCGHFGWGAEVRLRSKGLGSRQEGTRKRSEGAIQNSPCDAQCQTDAKVFKPIRNSDDEKTAEEPKKPGTGKYSWCGAMDVWEANSMATACAPHLGDARCPTWSGHPGNKYTVDINEMPLDLNDRAETSRPGKQKSFDQFWFNHCYPDVQSVLPQAVTARCSEPPTLRCIYEPINSCSIARLRGSREVQSHDSSLLHTNQVKVEASSGRSDDLVWFRIWSQS